MKSFKEWLKLKETMTSTGDVANFSNRLFQPQKIEVEKDKFFSKKKKRKKKT